MHKYKVKRDHRTVIIDSSEKHKISHCPAYMWVRKGRLYFLLMEETPREIWINSDKTAEISFSKETGDAANDYVDIRNNAGYMQLFGDCMPTYHEEYISRRRASVKNLYVVGDDIKLTNTSARAAFDLLKARFVLPEEYGLPKEAGAFTKEAYQTKLLWQDGVINTAEFKARTKKMLSAMTEAEISGQEYDRNLREMVEKQLITREYADYYADAKK